MHRFPLRSLMSLGLAVLLGLSYSARGEIAGAAGRPVTYRGVVEMKTQATPERCELMIQVERVGFLLTTVSGKYRFVRMLADCGSKTGLTLSSSADRLEAKVGDRTVPAVLSLQRSDAAFWDALDAEMRQTLAYPPTIKPGQPVYLFAYFPADDLKAMPMEFSFTIASLGQTVPLRNAATAARF